MDSLIETLLYNPTIRKFIIASIGILLIIGLLKIIKKNLFNYVKTESWYMTNKVINVIGYILVLFLGAVPAPRRPRRAVPLDAAGRRQGRAARRVRPEVQRREALDRPSRARGLTART